MNLRSKRFGRLLTAAAIVAASSSVDAEATLGDVPDKSCYDAKSLTQARPTPERLLLIGIDQTTLVPEVLGDRLNKTIVAALKPGDEVVFVSFSAYSHDHYVREEGRFHLEVAPTKEAQRRLPVSEMSNLLHCLDLQMLRSPQRVRASVQALLKEASASIKYSEIVVAFQAFGRRLSEHPAKDKILLVVSDGLEHASSTTSFYDKKTLRVIDPEAEVRAVQAKGLKANLAGAHVYFFGGGLIANDEGYRNQVAINKLAAFWSLFVAASGGSLQEFGAPEIQGPLR